MPGAQINAAAERQLGLLLPDVEGLNITMRDDDVVVVAVDHQLAWAIELRKRAGDGEQKAASPETLFSTSKPRV